MHGNVAPLDAIADSIVEAFSSIGLVTVLYVESNVCLCLPHLVEEITLNISIVFECFGCFGRCVVNCCQYYWIYVSSIVLSIRILSLVLYSARSGAKLPY